MLALVTGEAAKEAKAAEEAEVKARAMARGRAMAEATAAKAAAKAAAAKAGPAAGAGGKGAAKLPVGSAGAGVDRSVVEGAAGQGEGAGEMKKALPDANKVRGYVCMRASSTCEETCSPSTYNTIDAHHTSSSDPISWRRRLSRRS